MENFIHFCGAIPDWVLWLSALVVLMGAILLMLHERGKVLIQRKTRIVGYRSVFFLEVDDMMKNFSATHDQPITDFNFGAATYSLTASNGSLMSIRTSKIFAVDLNNPIYGVTNE